MRDGSTVEAFRRWGYLLAGYDPLGRIRSYEHPDLQGSGPEFERGRRSYAGPVAAEFMHLPFPDRCRWIAERMESDSAAVDRPALLQRLVEAEVLERVLQAHYVGSRRFSLEGMTALIPLLDEMLRGAAEAGADQAVLAMAHRGRLNVIVNVLRRAPRDIFARFEDVDPMSVLGSGDVKYHLGATGDVEAAPGRRMRIDLVANPSHLEAVDPVALGYARARQERSGADGRRRVIPILLHGDAAFAGQGIAAETLNLSELAGYSVGGTIHVVLDNVIGFTTDPPSLHSSFLATDVARRLPIPIFHVNAEEPEQVVRVARMATEYRTRFGTDVLVDLVGYRRHGHSEIDDPTTTQPVQYRKIQALVPLPRKYGASIGEPADRTERREEEQRHRLEEELRQARELETTPRLQEPSAAWKDFVGGPYDPGAEVETSVPEDRLRSVVDRLCRAPEGFLVHPKLAQLMLLRCEMGEGRRPVDWGLAEALALGSLLLEGVGVRLTGQDTRRGTFNHRHAVLFDTATGSEHVPLAHLDAGQARFDCFDSPLSEAAPLGFEYGYSREAPETLVLWEAQFGDFANGAQTIIDQYMTAGEDKWGHLSGLVLLLPHGFEGQGPEHSHARLERFLQLAAEDAFQVCQPSTAAQYFHLLRRQALRRWRKPLVVLTPKGLLRHPAAASPRSEFSSGGFRGVLGDPGAGGADRVLLCTGKIGHELRRERERRGDPKTAIVLVEELYPFPEEELAAALEPARGARELVWVQEEPANMGALAHVSPFLERLAAGRSVRSVKRSASASPATGSAKAHGVEQQALLEMSFARPWS